MWKSIVYTFLFLSASCFAHAYFTGFPDSVTFEEFFAENDELAELPKNSLVVNVEQLEDIVEELNRSKALREKRVKIWFVDNTNSNAGDGSYKNPFNTLVAAQTASKKGDIIFVFPGDNTITGMDQGFIMKNGQRLLGAGVHHVIDFPQKKLVVHAPTTTLPRITNTNGNVILLANSCEVSGINIVNITNGDGILGGDATLDQPQTLGIKNTIIRKNIISTLNRDQNLVNNAAIYLPNCRGHLIIQKNYILNVIANENASGRGISLLNRNLAVSSNVTIKKNIVSNIGADGIFLFHASPTGKVKAQVENNIVFNIGQLGNGFTIGTGAIDAGGQLCVKIFKNFCQNVSSGVNLFVGSTGTARVKAQVIDNVLARSGVLGEGGFLPGFIGSSFDNSHLCLKLVKNFSEFGYELNQIGSSHFKLEPLHGNLGLPFTVTGFIGCARHGRCSCEQPREPKQNHCCY